MTQTTISFNIQGKHESHRGSAEIVGSYNDGVQLATDIIGKAVKVNQIGIVGGHNIYESYADSGSDDYVYFAVPLS